MPKYQRKINFYAGAQAYYMASRPDSPINRFFCPVMGSLYLVISCRNNQVKVRNYEPGKIVDKKHIIG
jgi:hypothetical protein